MAGRSRILLVHSNPAWSSALGNALGEGLEAVQAATPEDAWPHVDTGRIDLIVAEERVGVAFLEDLSRRAPATPRAILLNGGDRRTWVEAAAEGHVFAAIPEYAPDLAPRLRALVAMHAEAPRGLSGCSVDLRAAGGRALISGPVLRLTSEQLIVRIEPGDGLDHFLPGREVEEVVIRRGDGVLVDALPAAVQTLRPDTTGGYELELTLSTQRAQSPVREEDVVRDPLQRASMVVEALRRGQLLMERTDGIPAHAMVRGRVDALADLLILDPPPPAFGPGCAVRFSFDSGGAHYRFFAALAAVQVPSGAAQLTALLPPELRGRRRARPRVSLADGEGVLEIVPLLGKEPVRRPAVDVDMEGLGFVADPGDLLPVGTRIPALRLVMPDGVSFKGTGRIVSRAAVHGGSGPRAVRCGVRLDPLAPEDQSALAGAILRRTHPGLELARGLSFDLLWEFLRDSGFIYPEKEAQLEPVMEQVRLTLGTLLANPHGPLRTLLFRGAGGLVQGHVAAVQAYRRTWMLQHLAARKDGAGSLAAAKALNAGAMEYLEQLPDAEWVRIWFRPRNRWPARTFGRFARLKFDPHWCDLRTYAYLVAPAAQAPVLDVPGLDVTFATAGDWAEIRRCFVARGDTALLAAEDLSRAPDLSEVDDIYLALGLSRRREALVARREGRLLGFALLEVTSTGVNMSELTSAFRMHALTTEPGVTAALAARARQRYAELGHPFAIGLATTVDAGAWALAGFSKVKEYTCLTAHRSLWRRYVEFVQRLYDVPARGVRPHA